MSGESPASRHPYAAAFAIASVLIAARLFLPAAALTFSPREAIAFKATGLPNWIRFALALPEMLGAVLFVFPKTFYFGASVLLLDLTGAIIVHHSLGIKPFGLYLLLGAVLSLALVHAIFLRCKLQR
jgi:hypothetical protein